MLIGVPALLVLALAAMVSCTSAPSPAEPAPSPWPPPERVVGSGEPYYGLSSIEERIAGSGVIARVRLRSVSPGAEVNDFNHLGNGGYVSTLEFRFQAVEYLKGSGGGEFTGVVYDFLDEYDTRQEAVEAARSLLSGRDTRWDGREAIVLLLTRYRLLPNAQQATDIRSALSMPMSISRSAAFTTGYGCPPAADAARRAQWGHQVRSVFCWRRRGTRPQAAHQARRARLPQPRSRWPR